MEKRTRENPYGITTQYEIVEAWGNEKKGEYYEISNNPNSHDKCSAIWNDVDVINKSMLKDKPIIAKNFTYKLATSKEEAKDFAKKYLISGLRKLKRYWSIKEKIDRDGQGKAIDDDENAFYETYVKPLFDKEVEKGDLL